MGGGGRRLLSLPQALLRTLVFPAFGRRLGFVSRCPGVWTVGDWIPPASGQPWVDGLAGPLLALLLASLSWAAEVHPSGNLGASPCLHFRRINLFTNVQELLSGFLAPLMASGFVRLSQWAFINSILPAWEGEPWPGLARKRENRK